MRLLRLLLKSSALRAAAALALSGLALACGNLLLARVLPAVEFSRFVLVFSLVQIGIKTGPIGADVILTRRRFDPGGKLHSQVLWTSAAVAIVLVCIARLLYPLNIGLLATVLVSIAAGGGMTVAIAHYRSQQRFGSALLLTASTSTSLLIASAVAMAVHAETALWPSLTVSISLCVTMLLGWRAIAAERRGPAAPEQPYPWMEAWSAVSFIAAGMILMNLDRLATPRFLSLADVATLSVLTTTAGSPFQMLQQGVGYTLVPALRNAKDQRHRLHVFRHEAWVIGLTCLISACTVLWLSPLIVHWVLASRYTISWQLLLAVTLVGILKVVGSLVTGAVNALGSRFDLAKLSYVGWLSIGVALAGGWIGARWGLAGLIYGIGCGWLLRAAVVGWIAVPRLWGADSPAAHGSARDAIAVGLKSSFAQRGSKE